MAGIGVVVQTMVVDRRDRAAVLFEWAPGDRPRGDASTCRLLGEAAARIHRAADTFS